MFKFVQDFSRALYTSSYGGEYGGSGVAIYRLAIDGMGEAGFFKYVAIRITSSSGRKSDPGSGTD